ncbi:MAG: ABC transporter permease [Lentisphaeria bacterium]|nr:ABC transporter permease [Lentisphaeria bacterium]
MIVFLQSAIRYSATFIFGCLGETITEKSGHLNLGIPGIMCGGVAGGCLGVSLYMGAIPNPAEPSYILLLLCGIIGAVLAGALLGGIYAFLTVTLKCNQNITGLALTTFGAGFTEVIMKTLDSTGGKKHFSVAATYIAKSPFPFADGLGWFGELFLSYGALVYFAIILAIVAGIILKNTRAGLNLRAVGENPAAADAVGIKVDAYKYGAILIGSSVAAIGGFFYVMDLVQGLYNSYQPVEAVGWLAIALVIFTLWRPSLSIVGSILFGALYTIPSFIPLSSQVVNAVLDFIPYVATVIVLLTVSIMGKKSVQPPSSLGVNYFREER